MITEPPTSPEHTEIRDMVRGLAATTFTIERVRAAADSPTGFDEVAWKRMVDLGWVSLALPAEAGGEELGAYVQCLVHRELGARLAPSPYLATAGFAAVALQALADERGHDLLGTIGTGGVVAALVLGHGRGWPEGSTPLVTARETDDGWVVDGRADLVLDAGRADVLVVTAAVGERGRWALFEVDARAAGVRREPVATVDATRSLADLTFDAVPARCLRTEPLSTDQVSGLVDRVVVYLAAEMIGAAVSCLQQTLDYLRTRRQFGKPIGSFQALKHRCADSAVAVTIVQELVFSTAAMLDSGDEDGLRLSAPLLLARVGEVFKHCTEEAIQLHGGVGFTDEFDVGLYYKRALVDTELLAATADAYARMELVRRAAIA